MSIKKYFILLCSAITLFSCGGSSPQPEHDYNLYTITTNTRDYIIEGDTKYQYGKEANLKIVPKNNAFLMPNDEDITVYGTSDAFYDKNTGELRFTVNRDVKIDIVTNSIYGREVTLAEAGTWFNAHFIEEDIYTWSKQNYNWNLPDVNFPDDQITKFITENLLNDGIFIKSTDITSSTGSKEITNTESEVFDRNKLDVGILGKDNNRYYISDDHLTFGSDVMPKATGAACGSVFRFFSFNNQIVLHHMDSYFNDFLPFRKYEFHSTLNGEIHWTTDSIKVGQ